MKLLIVLLYLCCSLANGQRKSQAESDQRHLTNIHDNYIEEFRCLKNLDDLLSSKWNLDLEKINTKDLGDVETDVERLSPTKEMYNTLEEEWLMESGSTSKEIDSCFRKIIPEIAPSLKQADINCLNKIFNYHIEEETVHEDVFKELLKLEEKNDLPFRRFISFNEFGQLMFQSRTPDALSDVERVVYEHAESYLTTEDERVIDKTYIMEQECEWKNARALRFAPGLEGRMTEFVRQVKDSVNQQLANRLLKNWNLNVKLPEDKYKSWLNSRRNMTRIIEAEVVKLRGEKRDAQWLCEHATKLAYKLSDEQGDIILGSERTFENLKVSDIADKTRSVEKLLSNKNDFRNYAIKILADKFNNGSRCLTAFLHLVQNHRKFDMALAFVDEDRYNYPQFYCKDKNVNLGLIGTKFCKCVGSFCVAHPLAALFAEEYALVQSPDGVFKVVLSGVKSRDKIAAWKR